MFDIWDRISSVPFDLLLVANEARLSIDWDAHATSLGLPIGGLATVVAMLMAQVVSYYGDAAPSNSLLASNYQQIKQSIIDGGFKGTPNVVSVAAPSLPVIWGVKMAFLLLWMTSVLLIYSIFTASKEYGLLYTQQKPNSTSAVRRVLNVFSPLRMIWEKIANDFVDAPKEENHIDSAQQIWTLHVWSPSKFAMYVAASFNPINLAIITWVKCSTIALVGTVVLESVSTFILIKKFLSLIKDKQILQGELMSEYYSKFVKPRTQILKRDVAIDAGLGPWRAQVWQDDEPYTFVKSRVFVTHDIRGDEVVEYVEPSDAKPVEVNEDANLVLERLRIENERLRLQNHELSRISSRPSSRQGSVIERNQSFFSNDDDDDDEDGFTSAMKRQKYPFQQFKIPSPQRPSGRLSAHTTPKLSRNSISLARSPSTRSPSPTRPLKQWSRSPSHLS